MTIPINGAAPAKEIFTVNRQGGATIAIRDMTDLELKLACDSFEQQLQQAIAVSHAAQQNLLNVSMTHGAVRYEMDRRSRLSLHL